MKNTQRKLQKIYPFIFMFLLCITLSSVFAVDPGKEFKVNKYTKDSQWYHALAMNGKGNFVIVWESEGQDKESGGVYGQRFSPTGKRLGNEFRVNTTTKSVQGSPSVAMDKKGNFVVVWESYGQKDDSYEVYAQRFKKGGKKTGKETRVNTYTENNQFSPEVAMDDAGNFVVTWTSRGQDTSLNGVYAQRFSKTGKRLKKEFRVNSYTANHQWLSKIAMDKSGQFVVVWESENQDGDSGGIYAQVYDKSGKMVGTELRVNTHTESVQGTPNVTMDVNGNFIVTWDSWEQDGNKYGIFARVFDKDGNPQLGEFQVNKYKKDNQWFSAVAVDKRGNFAIAYESINQDSDRGGVFVRRFTQDGKAVGKEFQANEFTTGNQGSPAIGMDFKGNFIVAWESSEQDGDKYGIYARRFKK